MPVFWKKTEDFLYKRVIRFELCKIKIFIQHKQNKHVIFQRIKRSIKKQNSRKYHYCRTFLKWKKAQNSLTFLPRIADRNPHIHFICSIRIWIDLPLNFKKVNVTPSKMFFLNTNWLIVFIYKLINQKSMHHFIAECNITDQSIC
jgi:hypothetical protein